VEAARIATFVKDVVYAFAARGGTPGNILSDVNDALLRKGAAGFVTVLVAILSPDRRHLAFCSAGHPSLIRRGAKGNAALLVRKYSPPLGLFPEWSCSVGEVALVPGDLLLLYTDGVIEARGGSELFGESRLLRWLDRRSDVEVHALPGALLADVLKFSGGNLHDDAAIVAVQIGGR
jgi:sigma-B regulation protein RsbU (phosphoserine phosphatase)